MSQTKVGKFLESVRQVKKRSKMLESASKANLKLYSEIENSLNKKGLSIFNDMIGELLYKYDYDSISEFSDSEMTYIIEYGYKLLNNSDYKIDA